MGYSSPRKIPQRYASKRQLRVTNDHTLRERRRHLDVRQTANWADDVGVKP
jgi:hypothetical protein